MPQEQPRALIVTIYGLYGRAEPAAGSHEAPGWLPISGLVRLMADLDVDEPAVRSAISRLKRRGFLRPEQRGGVAGYALSEHATGILDDGDARIFAVPEPKLADGWLLAVFSVPETERAQRHRLRTQLAALGFGAAAAGVWLAPAHRFALTATTLERQGLAGYVDLFRAEYLAFGDIETHARQWWDLDGIAADYRAFIRAYTQISDRTPFADWVRALTAWRRLPYRDPCLPVELRPPDWPGDEARAVLEKLRTTLGTGAGEAVVSRLGPGYRRADG